MEWQAQEMRQEGRRIGGFVSEDRLELPVERGAPRIGTTRGAGGDRTRSRRR
jgi:hypothetical protein